MATSWKTPTNRLFRITTLTDGATVTPDADTTDIGEWTIGGNRTLAAPSGTPRNGQQLMLRIKQDATGSRLVTWNSIYTFPGGGTPTLSITANALDVIGFQYNSATSKWECMAVQIADTSRQVLFQGRATSDQNLALANTWYSVELHAEDYDTHNGHDNVTNNTRWVAPYTGDYLVSGAVLWKYGESTVNPVRGVRLAVNGTVVNNSSRWYLYMAAELLTADVVQLVHMNVNDYLEMQAYTGNNAANDNTLLFGQSTDGSMLIVKSVFI